MQTAMMIITMLVPCWFHGKYLLSCQHLVHNWRNIFVPII